jgi:nitrate reductase assembly molybdenum cofactor insertion protein NarJ
MVDLLAMYEQRGLAAVKNELPDFLPLVLEFLSVSAAAEKTC